MHQFPNQIEITFQIKTIYDDDQELSDNLIESMIQFVEERSLLCGGGGLQYSLYDPENNTTFTELKEEVLLFCKSRKNEIREVLIMKFNPINDHFEQIEICDLK